MSIVESIDSLRCSIKTVGSGLVSVCETSTDGEAAACFCLYLLNPFFYKKLIIFFLMDFIAQINTFFCVVLFGVKTLFLNNCRLRCESDVLRLALFVL